MNAMIDLTTKFDTIVVGAGAGAGAGAAGCVVAARLSEDHDRRALLVEAGGHNTRLSVRAPAAFSSQFETKLDWNYLTEPEENLHGRRLFEPRGKMLGGCSSMNAMMYVRGNRLDYDGWWNRALMAGVPTTCCRTSVGRRTTRTCRMRTTGPVARCTSRPCAVRIR